MLCMVSYQCLMLARHHEARMCLEHLPISTVGSIQSFLNSNYVDEGYTDSQYLCTSLTLLYKDPLQDGYCKPLLYPPYTPMR